MSTPQEQKKFTIFDQINFPAYQFKPYPKMLYSGETRVVDPGESVNTPAGVQLRNKHEELIHRTVNDEEEEAAARAAGWVGLDELGDAAPED